MPITIRWFDDTKCIVLWEVEGHWTLEEFHAIYTESHTLCLTVPENTVNGLLDMTRATGVIPSNIFSALNTRTRSNSPNYDMTVIVSDNTMIKVFVNIMNKMPVLHEQFMLVTTVEAGLAFIEKRRQEREAAPK